MSDKTRLGLGIVGAGLLLGLLGDALLRAVPWGINVCLWILLLVVVTLILIRWYGLRLTGGGRWMVIPSLVFALLFAWRASPTLMMLNLWALLASLGLAALRSQAGRVRVAGLAEYSFGLFLAGLQSAIGGFPLLMTEIQWRQIPREGWSGRSVAVGRGLVLALPVVVVFGGLFMAADAAFQGIVRQLFNLDMRNLVSHGFMIIVLGWFVVGALRLTLMIQETTPTIRRVFSLGNIEVGIILGLLNALFLAFVLVQFRYFFGGAALVETSTTLTYAEYARRGFFELVNVAALVLPLLLFLHWTIEVNSQGDRVYRLLATTLILQLFIVMTSAFQRMRLYQAEFGLTELRLYTSAFMAWLALVCGWFLLTVVRQRSDRFVFGALTAGFAVIVGLNVLNPDALIVQVNVERKGLGWSFDRTYAISLSHDAVPTLVAALPMLGDDAPCTAQRLYNKWAPPVEVDWRTWNWGRTEAWRATSDNQDRLLELTRACATPQSRDTPTPPRR